MTDDQASGTGSDLFPSIDQHKKHPCHDCKMCQWCSDSRCTLCRGSDRGRDAFEHMSMAEQIEMYERLNREEGK